MKPPSKLRIGPYNYEVTLDADAMNGKQVAEKTDLFGFHSPKEQRIYLHPESASDIMADSLLHETLHALFMVFNENINGGDEEFIINALSPLLLDTLRRNPRLVAYLVGE